MTIATADFSTALFEAGVDRTLKGLLVPFGEEGHNANGATVFSAGTVELPADPKAVSLKIGHDGELSKTPIGHAIALEETEQGIIATFQISEGLAGDRLLAEYAKGNKKSLSAEFTDFVKDGVNVVKAKLADAAAVVLGAFPSAAFFEIAAPAETETDDDIIARLERELAEAKTKAATKTTDEAPAAEVTEPETPAQAEGESTVTTAVPNTLEQPEAVTPSEPSKAEVFSILHAIRSGRATAEMVKRLEEHSGPAEREIFALNDIKLTTSGSVGVNITVPMWIKELWAGVGYEQQIVPLFNHADLTGMKINGFRWTTKPAGGTWAGDKANVPSNTPATEPYTTTAKRFAGGHDIAREYRDFDVEGFFESYYAAMAESYAQWVDETVVLTDVLAGATTVEADNPSGLTIGAGLSAIIDGASEVIAAKALPSFALVAPALWKAIMKTPDNATIGYLSAALGFKEGELGGFVIRPSALLSAGNVLVGARDAVTVYELAGTPIRVEAPDMVKGGIDTGVFGYAGTVIHKPTALQLVTPYTP